MQDLCIWRFYWNEELWWPNPLSQLPLPPRMCYTNSSAVSMGWLPGHLAFWGLAGILFKITHNELIIWVNQKQKNAFSSSSRGHPAAHGTVPPKLSTIKSYLGRVSLGHACLFNSKGLLESKRGEQAQSGFSLQTRGLPVTIHCVESVKLTDECKRVELNKWYILISSKASTYPPWARQVPETLHPFSRQPQPQPPPGREPHMQGQI